MGNELVEVTPMFRIDCISDTRTDCHLAIIYREWLGDGSGNASSKKICFPNMLRAHLKKNEFIAPNARCYIRRSERPKQSLGHRLQQRVARRMTEAVVDRFKAVKVQIVNDEALTMP
jgi:hypothetical protein